MKGMQRRLPFWFLITYFKSTGKYYTEAAVQWEIRTVENSGRPMAYYQDAIAKVRGLRDTGGPGALPGLSGEGWDGMILICEAMPDPEIKQLSQPLSPDEFIPCGVPHILLPQDVEDYLSH